ncbi:MAG: PaRep2b protein [Pyrobaculum sp.]
MFSGSSGGVYGGAIHMKLYGEEARRFARNALPYLVALERVLEVVKSDEQIYSKVAKLIDMARSEKVKAWIREFTAEGKRPRARLVVEADGATAEYQIRLHENNAVELRFDTTDGAEAERRAAVLRAVGVKAEVGKYYNKSLGRDEWQIVVTTNALAAEAVHDAVRRAVAEFLRQCREAGVLADDTYRRLAAKFERGVPEWGEVRFSVRLTEDGAIEVTYEPRDPQSFREAVKLLRKLGMRDVCEGDWCVVHFTAREPEGSEKGFVRITADGLRYIGWLALHGDEKAQRLKEMLLKEAERKGEKVRRRLEQYFREGEMWGSVKPPIEKEVEVEGRWLKVRIEEVEAAIERGKTRGHLVVRVKAKVFDGNSEVAVEKEARFFKTSGGVIRGYVNIQASAEGGREADYVRTAAVLKALGVESWSRQKKQIRLTGGALDTLMRLEPVSRALNIHQRNN